MSVEFLEMSSSSLSYGLSFCWLTMSRSKSVTLPSRFLAMMARLRSLTETWNPSTGTAEKSRSFLNLNRTDILQLLRLLRAQKPV